MLSNTYFIQALCYKQLKDYPSSNKYYKKFMKLALKNKRRELTKYIWGLVLLPIVQEKKEVINFIENVKDIVDFYGFKQPEDPISTHYDFKEKKWNENSTEAVLQFFKR